VGQADGEDFQMTTCLEEDKVIYATHQFKGAAKDWWKGAKRRMEANDIYLTWNNFKSVDGKVPRKDI
jgi:hypothetical protein